jgi:hypothetical protein
MKKITFIVNIVGVFCHKLTLGGDFVSALRSPVVGPTASTPTLVGSTCAVRTFFLAHDLGFGLSAFRHNDDAHCLWTFPVVSPSFSPSFPLPSITLC